MPKASPIQSSFGGGEISPLLYGRVDLDRYKTSLATCLNYIPTIQGGLTRRPGSYFVAEVKTSSKKTRLIEFEFSTTQAYIIEFGDQYLRFYKDRAQILSGPAYEIASPFLEANLFQLKFTQSADVLYITHPSYAPRKLTRTGHTAWTLTEIDFLDGPYLPVNTTATTLTPSATSGSITVTASASLFASTDVGRIIRIQHGSTWGWVEISAYTSATQVTATVRGNLGNTTAVTTWRLGLWSTTTGFPGCVVFHEDRLCFSGASGAPQRIDGSKTGDYENFAPTAADGTVAADNAISFTLNSNDVNVTRWLTSDEKGMLAGTVGGGWVIRPSSQGEAISPTNVSAKQTTSFGSADIEPVQSGKATLYIQRSGKKLREMSYFYSVDGFEANDLTVLSEHITGEGLTEIAIQREPQNIVWGVRQDGALIGMTYERDSESLKVGWHRHVFGGYGDAANNQAVVESVAVIPSPDGSSEDVWLVVKRYINGATKRYIEYLTPLFDDLTEQKDAFFVDCGLTYDDPKTISGATAANPVVITATSHGFNNGDAVLIDDVLGMTELNTNTYTVANKTANTFELSGINGTAFTAYVSGGKVRKYVTSISGLSHLEGQTVKILADGAVLPSETVSGGAITLDYRATTVHVGLGYNSDAKLLRIDAGSADGTSLGKTRRNHRVGLLLHRTLGLKLGMSFDELDEITFRRSSDALTRAPALFSGVQSESLSADYDYENQICIRQDQPLPGTILAVMPQMVTQDRG